MRTILYAYYKGVVIMIWAFIFMKSVIMGLQTAFPAVIDEVARSVPFVLSVHGLSDIIGVVNDFLIRGKTR